MEEHGEDSIYDTSGMREGYNIPPVNRRVLGKFKDETNGDSILEFVGIRPKSYSFIHQDGAEDIKAPGIPKVCVRNQLCHNDYVQLLETKGLKTPAPTQYTRFATSKLGGEMKTVQQCRKVVSAEDPSRLQYNRADGEWHYETRPIGWSGELPSRMITLW